MSEVNYSDGTLNALGLDINISDILGEKIVNQFMARISEDDMKLIFDAIEREVFGHNYNDEKYFVTTRTIPSGSRWEKDRIESTPIWRYAQNLYQQKFNEKIKEKVDEIISSESFKKRADEIAEEIVGYATNGYKEDMKARIRERMIDNIITPNVYYNGVDLRSIIHQELQNYIHH